MLRYANWKMHISMEETTKWASKKVHLKFMLNRIIFNNSFACRVMWKLNLCACRKEFFYHTLTPSRTLPGQQSGSQAASKGHQIVPSNEKCPAINSPHFSLEKRQFLGGMEWRGEKEYSHVMMNLFICLSTLHNWDKTIILHQQWCH